MAKRIKQNSILNWVKNNKILSSSIIGVPSLLVMFMMLISSGIVSVDNYNANEYCGGDVVCYLELQNTCFKDDVFLYVNTSDAMSLIHATPTDVINDIRLYRSWGNSWREINIEQGCTGTWCGKPNSDKRDYATYSYAFREGKCYDLRVEIDKPVNSTIKWSINPRGEFKPAASDLFTKTISRKTKKELNAKKDKLDTKVGCGKLKKDDINIRSQLLDSYRGNGSIIYFEINMSEDYNVWINDSGNVIEPVSYEVNGHHLIGFNYISDLIELHIGDESDIYTIDLVDIDTIGQSYIWQNNFAHINESNRSKGYSIINESLVAYYDLNGDAVDSIGVNNGTISGPNNTTGHLTNAQSNTALEFDGNNDYVSIPKEVITTNTFSISFWENSVASNVGYLLSDSNDVTNLFLRRGPGASGGEVSGFLGDMNFGALTLSNEVWHHHVIVSDNTNGYWYIDGELKSTILDSNFTNLTTDFYIGNNFALSRDLAGKIDNLRIYDKALSVNEIKGLYEEEQDDYTTGGVTFMQSVNKINDTGLVSLWRLDGNAIDYTGLNNGTISGATNSTECRYNECLYFDGTNDNVAISTIDYSTYTSGVSHSVWVKAEPETESRSILTQGTVNFGTAAQYEFIFGITSGEAIVFRFSNSTDFIVNGITTATISENVWNNIVVTWTGDTTTDGVNVYVNGVLIQSFTATATINSITYTANNYIGGINTDTRTWAGYLDNVIIWNRSLGAKEVSDLYLSSHPIPSAFTTLTLDFAGNSDVSYYTFSSDNVPFTAYENYSSNKSAWYGYYSNNTNPTFTSISNGGSIDVSNIDYIILKSNGTSLTNLELNFATTTENVNITSTLCPSITKLTYNPSVSFYDPLTGRLVQDGIFPENQTLCGYTYQITNEQLGSIADVQAKLDSVNSDFIFNINDINLTTSYQTIYNNLAINDTIYIDVLLDINISLLSSPVAYDFNVVFKGVES